MKKFILIIVTILMSMNYIFCQKLTLNTYNAKTNLIIPEAEIHLSTHNMKKFFAAKTNENGKIEFNDLGIFCDEDTIIIRVSKKGFYTKYFYHICSENKLSNYNLALTPQKNSHYDYTLDFIFYEGTSDLDSTSEIKIRKLFPVYLKEMKFQFLMHVNYKITERNGFELSINRANKLLELIIDNGWKGDEFFIKVNKGTLPYVNFEILGNIGPYKSFK